MRDSGLVGLGVAVVVVVVVVVVVAFREDERAGFADQWVLVHVFVVVAEGEVEGVGEETCFLEGGGGGGVGG